MGIEDDPHLLIYDPISSLTFNAKSISTFLQTMVDILKKIQ